MLLENKVAIITGAGSGLGKAAALLFAENGASVVVADFNIMSSKAVVEEIKERGGEALSLWVNVADRTSVESMVKHTKNLLGKIDILVNNAGITADKKLVRMTEEMFDRVIDVNMKGVFHCTQAVLPHMIEQQSGVIINTSSVVADGNIGQTNYAATKAAVRTMARTWALELAPKGIRVNAVAPGFIATEMTVGKMRPEDLKAVESKIPMGHLGEPNDIAEAYLFLASDKAKYITGTTLHVDGGLVI
jgi:3-oxoacyl-[acyl-carrier protein] reductase